MMIKRNTIAIAILFAISANVHAVGNVHIVEKDDPVTRPNQGSGTIEFIGSIIDAPCSISPETMDQTVNMGQVSNATLDFNGQGRIQPFEIKLQGCAMDTASAVDVTFTGVGDGNGKMLALQGNAQGAAIELKNMSNGTVIELGKATSFSKIFDGTNTLKFGATLVKTASSKEGIVPGDYTATADFILAYK